MVIKRLIDYLDTDRFKKILNILTIFVMFLYLFISLSAYAQWFPGSRRIFAYSTTSGLVIRVLLAIIFLFCTFLNFVSCRKEINKIWLIPFLIIILFGIVFTFFTPTEYRSLYRTTALYNFMGEMINSVSDMTLLKMSLSFIVDILFGFSFMFILPKSLKNKKFYLYFALAFMLVIFYSCVYSLIKERDYYKNFISGNWEYNPVTIQSIFTDKQSWGIFLAACVPTSVLSIYLAIKIYSKQKFLSFLIIAFSVVTFLLSLSCSIVCFCKTAIVANILVVIVLLLGIGLYFLIKRKNFFIGVLFLGILVIFLLIPTLFSSVPALQGTKIGSLILKIFNTLVDRGETGFGSRMTILFSFLEKFPSTNLMFGFNKGVLEAYEYSVTPEIINSLHTGIAIFFGRTGLIGLLIYCILIGLIVKSICKITKENLFYGFIFISLFCSSTILNFAELEILVTSSSATVFVYNVLFVVLCLREANELKEEKNEKNISVVTC